MARAWILVVMAMVGWGWVGSVWAWSEGGHKTVALLAYAQLRPEQRARICDALRHHPLWHEFFEAPMAAALGPSPKQADEQRWLFAQASVWPDLVRPAKGSDPADNPYKAYHHPTWHYTDLPVFHTEEDRKHLGYHLADPPMEWSPDAAKPHQGSNSVQALKKARHELSSAKTTPEERAVMICWLMHLVGDMHQPCHCAALYWPHKLPKGDRGANDLSLWSMGGKPLHAYWDGLLDVHGSGLAAIEKRTASLEHTEAGTTSSTAWEPEEWLQEGRAAAGEHVYTAPLLHAMEGATSQHPPGGGHAVFVLHLPEEDLRNYERQAHACAERQIFLAGARLAKALREVNR